MRLCVSKNKKPEPCAAFKIKNACQGVRAELLKKRSLLELDLTEVLQRLIVSDWEG